MNIFYGRFPPFSDSFKKGCYQLLRMYVHQLLVNRLFKPAPKKVLNCHRHMIIAVDCVVKQQNKQTEYSIGI